MLPDEAVPDRLVDPSQRAPIPVERVPLPSRFRTWFVVRQLLWLGFRTEWLRWTGRLTPKVFAAEVRDVFKRLGPLWIQAGKFMAMRSDLVPVEFSRELALLRDQASGFPFSDAKEIIEGELGGTLDRHFDEFDRAPFAASSNFQLHRARLRREQVCVAVKVQRPFAETVVAQDLAAIRRVTRWFAWLKIQPRMHWHDLYREIEEQLSRELDFRFEASALGQLAKTLPRHGIHVPDLFLEYCTRRVLVMEYLRGVLLSDYFAASRREPERIARWHEANGVHPRKVARRLFHSVWRQIFEDNYFHADMHPGNVILLRDNRLAIIDCRSIGFLEVEQLRKIRMYYRSLSRAEFSTAAEHFFLLAYRLPVVELGDVKAQFVRVWRRWESRNYVRDLPSHEKSLTQMLDELNRIMHRYGFEIQWSMAKLAWTLVNADTSILPLSTSINYLKWLDKYFRGASRRQNRINPDELARRSFQLWNSMQEWPRMIVESSVAQQEIVRRQAQVVQSSTYKSSYVLATLYEFLALGFLGAAIVASQALVVQHLGNGADSRLKQWLGADLHGMLGLLPTLEPAVWLIMIMLLAYLSIRAAMLRRRSLRKDVPPESRLPVGLA
jgi:ubiquinone biosynthesis protein